VGEGAWYVSQGLSPDAPSFREIRDHQLQIDGLLTEDGVRAERLRLASSDEDIHLRALVNELSWPWIVLMATAPPLMGVLVAFPVWRTKEIVLGNLAGTAVIFGAAVALILREFVELDGLTKRCLDSGITCWPNPSVFTRCAIYASIGLIEVFALFTLSLKVEDRIRKRERAPEWR
jgi:hypothetical protein